MKLFDVSQSVLDAVKSAMETDIVLDESLKDYKHKHVQGLYNYNHFEHSDGSFVQVGGNPQRYIHQDARGNRKEFGNLAALKAHVDNMGVHKEEVLDERNKENKFKKDLHVAQKGKYVADRDGTTLQVHRLEGLFDSGPEKKRENMAYLLKTFKKKGREMTQANASALKKEEVEQVDELKKTTLASYISGASADKSALAHDIGKINQIAADTGTSAKDRAERDALSKKHGLRSLGINRAANKLAKEETVLETDDGWYTHNEIHGSKGISAADWKKGWRLNKDGKRVQTKKEETEVAEGRDAGATWGVSTPLRKKGVAVSDNGRHIAKIKRDVDNNEYRVELHSDGKHHEPADYFTDDKEDAHSTAKAMVAHAQKHEKPLKESVEVIEAVKIGNGISHIVGNDFKKVGTFANEHGDAFHLYHDPSGDGENHYLAHAQTGEIHHGFGGKTKDVKKHLHIFGFDNLPRPKTPSGLPRGEEERGQAPVHKEETALISKIINKYNK